ncbi:hypothetical protein RB195_003466 [Necator americanus]|uniref:G-protein coupled receptors family 1 profile domain-containing protein n=1 Tax=Necator americanus TaxID=51031 RepID=A0ABR1DNP0_NECAM
MSTEERQYPAVGVLPLAVAIDRILAIMIPTKYMRFNFRYTIIVAAGEPHIEKAQINGVQIGSLRRSTITVGLSTVNAVIFLLIPDIIKYLAIYNDSLTHIIILYSLSMTNVDLNALIFGFRHREIATSMRRFFCTIVITSTATKKRIIPRRVAAT